MTGYCIMCGNEFAHLSTFCEWRGNCRQDMFACRECLEKRASNGGTCLSCVHYDGDRMPTQKRGVCNRYHRYCEFSDRCGQYEEMRVTIKTVREIE